METTDNKESVFIEIAVTDKCNCNCKYCFEKCHEDKSSDTDRNRHLSLLKDYCEKFNQEKYSHIVISFWGGEPMMNKEYLFKLIEETEKYNFVYYQIYSNGTLTESWKEFTEQSWFESIRNRFEIQFSYDGEPHHSLMRGNNADKIFESVNVLHDNGMSVNFKATLSHSLIPKLPTIWESYHSLFREYIDFNIYYCPTLDTTNSTFENYDEWDRVLKEIIVKERKFILKYDRPLWLWFKEKNKINCNINNRIHIATDGNIYLCHGCPYSDETSKFIIGNTNKISSLSEVIKYRVDSVIPIKCLQCDSNYCAVCHVNTMDNEKNIEEVTNHWCTNRDKLEKMCKYYQIFSKYSRILKNSLI